MKKHEVIKHTGAIHISNTLTLIQRKVSNVLLKNAYQELNVDKLYTISVSDLSQAAGFNSKDIDILREALLVLNRTQLEWNILGKDKKKEWGCTTILSHAKLQKGKGICEYSYSPPMREMLSNPNIYARLNLLVQTQFKSKHALAIWEFLVEFLCSNKFQSGYTEWLSIEDFKNLLGIQNDPLYREFKYLNQRLLKKSLKEINTVSDITAIPEYKKESRRVIAIRFLVSKKEHFKLPNLLNTSPLKQNKENNISQQIEKNLDTQLVEKLNPVLERLLFFGLTNNQAIQHQRKYDEAYILKNLDVVEKNIKTGNVANVTAYTLTALKEDYRPKKTELEKRSEEKKERLKMANMKRERQELFKTLLQKHNENRLKTAFQRLKNTKRTELENEFIKFIKTENNRFVMKNFKETGFKSIVVQSSFDDYSKKNLLKTPPIKKSFVRFLKSQGYLADQFKEELKNLK